MSMIGCFYALNDEQLEEIIDDPARIHGLLDAEPGPGAAMDGSKASEQPEQFDVDKAWHGIHFLLTGSEWEGDGQLAFILHGGREISEDLGYGPPHGFTSAEVKEIDAALRALDPAALYEQADPGEFMKNAIYPEIWDSEPKEECIGYVMEHFKALQQFISSVAQSGRALIVYIG